MVLRVFLKLLHYLLFIFLLTIFILTIHTIHKEKINSNKG